MKWGNIHDQNWKRDVYVSFNKGNDITVVMCDKKVTQVRFDNNENRLLVYNA